MIARHYRELVAVDAYRAMNLIGTILEHDPNLAVPVVGDFARSDNRDDRFEAANLLFFVLDADPGDESGIAALLTSDKDADVRGCASEHVEFFEFSGQKARRTKD